MNIKPRGERGVLWLDVAAVDSPTGQRIRTSLGTTDKTAAQRKAKEILEGERKVGRDLTLGAALEKAQRDLWADCKAQQFYTSSISVLGSMLGASTLLHKIDEDMVQVLVAKLRAKGNSTSTINRRLAVLSRLLRAAHREWRILGRVPYIPRLREPQGRTRTYSISEQQLIMEWCWENDRELGRLADFLFATGARVSEALRLQPGDVSLGIEPSVTFRVTKGGTPRTIPVTARVAAEAKKGFNFPDSDTAAKHWLEMRTQLGFETDKEFVAHSVRHTVATRLLQAGWDVAKVKVWMGHKDIKTTARYLHLVSADLQSGAQVLDQGARLRVVS